MGINPKVIGRLLIVSLSALKWEKNVHTHHSPNNIEKLNRFVWVDLHLLKDIKNLGTAVNVTAANPNDEEKT